VWEKEKKEKNGRRDTSGGGAVLGWREQEFWKVTGHKECSVVETRLFKRLGVVEERGVFPWFLYEKCFKKGLK